MERRKALKNLSGLAALAFLPKQHLFALQQKKPLHIVGLGSAGAKVLQLIKSKGYGDIYTAINDGEDLNDDPFYPLQRFHDQRGQVITRI